VKAANSQHGPWGFALYLAVLLGMGDQESGFRNVREGGDTGWYNPPSIVVDPAGFRRFQQLFANSASNPLTPSFGGTKREAGVGVMQLTDRNLKEAADKLKDPSLVDEYVGGRWNPCANIMEAAIYLRSLLRPWESSNDPENIWQGVGAYNGGPNWKSKPSAVAYMNAVRHKVLDPGGYLDQVKQAFSTGFTPVPANTLVYPLGRKHDGYPNFPMGGVRAHYGKPPDNWQSNNACDLGTPVGTAVYAMAGGRVIGEVGVGANSQFGSFSHLQGHQLDPDAPDVDSGMKGLRLTVQESQNERYYAHLHQLAVRPGQSVQAGQLLGYSGWANAAHLHIAEHYPDPQNELPPGNMEEVIRGAKFKWELGDQNSDTSKVLPPPK
jgi:murein DD-endopeptidase MepM/ murein hydrolase activator NlpD